MWFPLSLQNLHCLFWSAPDESRWTRYSCRARKSVSGIPLGNATLGCFNSIECPNWETEQQWLRVSALGPSQLGFWQLPEREGKAQRQGAKNKSSLCLLKAHRTSLPAPNFALHKGLRIGAYAFHSIWHGFTMWPKLGTIADTMAIMTQTKNSS